MKKRKMLCALLLVGIMAAGLGTKVSAEGTDTKPPHIDTNGTATITKNLEMSEGISMPDTVYSFIATPITDGAPDATISDITYSQSDNPGTATNGKYMISKDSPIIFGAFPHAGKYEYTVTETKGSDQNTIYSTESYKLHVYVVNEENGSLKIASITAEKDNVKQSKVEFTNIYQKKANLTITKKVTGDLADKTKDFRFKITFTKVLTSNNKNFTGMIGNETINCTAGQAAEFELHDGEVLAFKDLPVGTRYVVEELAEADGYIPSVKVIENGEELPEKTAATEADGITSEVSDHNDTLVGEKENSVTFTNAYTEVAITGIIMNNLPFILLIGIGACALGVLMISKKRRTVNR